MVFTCSVLLSSLIFFTSIMRTLLSPPDSDSRSSRNRCTGHWLLRSNNLVSSDLCLAQSLCDLIGSRYTLSQASEEPIKDTLHHVSSQLSETSACHSIGRLQGEGCHLHFIGHSKRFPSLQLLMGVRRRKRTLKRCYMLWHFKGDYFFFPSIM